MRRNLHARVFSDAAYATIFTIQRKEAHTEMIDSDRKPSWLELESVVKMPAASRITSLSPDTIRREYADYVVQLSARRDGVKLRHCLEIAAGKARRQA
jgi:hypothetical protein